MHTFVLELVHIDGKQFVDSSKFLGKQFTKITIKNKGLKIGSSCLGTSEIAL